MSDLTFALADRSVTGILGPNGAGKTTTIRMLAGLLRPDEGDLRVVGVDVRRRSDRARRAIGYLPESAPLHPEMRAIETLRYRAGLLGLAGRAAREAIERVVSACELGSVTGRLNAALSKGFRQRVGLAAAILGDPRLLILDEPSVGLDPLQLRGFRRLVRELASTRCVLLSSHILGEVEAVCDAAILLRGGRLVASGSMADLVAAGSGRIEVEVRGDRARESLRTIDERVEFESLADGWLRGRLQPLDRGDDAFARIATRLAGDGVALRSLRRERASLESLFVAATAEPEGAVR